MTERAQTILTVAMAAFTSGWLTGLWFPKFRPRPPEGSYGSRHPDWRRSFNHENTNRPGGPPPLKFRRSEPDPPEQFIRMDEGPVQRGNGNGAPATPKPKIIPRGQLQVGPPDPRKHQMTKPTPLSPAAKAVYEAAIEQSEYPNDAEWVAINTLRAAADQVVPEVVNAVGDEHDEARRDQWLRIRYKFLAIAAELDGTQPTSESD